jgi:spore coat protein SA
MIYHVPCEGDAFSAYRGGAVIQIIANMMRFDLSSVVVCQSADDTWGYGADRILVIPELRTYFKLRGRKFLPLWITGPLFRHFYQPLLSRLKNGDIVWCHNQPAICAALAEIIHLKEAKLIYHSHSSVAFYARRPHFRSFVADAWIFISEVMQKEALGFFPWLNDTYVVHNGADDTLFYPQREGEGSSNPVPVVLYVGRLDPDKGVHVLMAAMNILQERKVNALCKVVGSYAFGGSKSTSYVKSLHKSSPSNVQFEDWRSGKEIADEYRAADILCCPSIWQEPFGNVNIEAMACGIPVVATRVGGIPEIAAEGGVLLVEPNSAVELADALQKLIEDKDLRTRIAQTGRQSFRRRFTWPIIVGQYQEIVKEME